MRISDWSSDVCSSDLHQVVALDLAEIRIERGGELELAAGLPEDVGTTLEVAAAADVVVHARHVRRDRQQRLAVHRHLERPEIRQEARLREAGHRPPTALSGAVDYAVDVDRSGVHTSELQSLMRNSYAIFVVK